ncbi:beta-galactosidase-like [Toxorhynchites rutilus septentrionalis]|uniref:beta-galactosidase-like n=1 Tax=Toxorhynchites rutilus septentrionalis TaxID=329112 RepID=UPI00247947BE|nr:beta-galactosidase-like [Toxorhynchites rutilus septentrionalis]
MQPKTNYLVSSRGLKLSHFDKQVYAILNHPRTVWFTNPKCYSLFLCAMSLVQVCRSLSDMVVRTYVLLLTFIFLFVEIKSGDHGINRSFSIDYEKNTFLMDGKPFRFVSGSFHYFRALPGSWRHILRSMRAAGLNAVMTYIEWSTHEPTEGEYKWDGIANLEQFIRIAEEEDLYVILRPGPYICAERDMGGFPYWLLTKYPNIKLREYDSDYLRAIDKWYSMLMPRIQRHLYGSGGPVIMISIENEYGSYSACDRNYLLFLKNITERYVQNNAVLFTNDGPDQLRCGRIPGVLATLDFGATNNPENYWKKLRMYQPKGPLVNAEFYPGWLTHWMEPMARVRAGPVIDTLRMMLRQQANVNFYMFFGGTNFAFTSGANDGGPGRFNTDITSYDYDAPLDEAGDPTPKYFALRDVILEFLPDPGVPVQMKLPKMKLQPVKIKPCGTLLSEQGRQILARSVLSSERTLSFEELNQHSGFVLYEANIPKELHRDPLTLKVTNLRDRAYVHVDNNFIGVLSRENAIYSIPISLGMGNRLQLLVENQGRINYGIANDFKGILGDVTLDGQQVFNWTMTSFPLDDYFSIQNYIEQYSAQSLTTNSTTASTVVYHGKFTIDADEIHDTYVNPTGWGKGIIFINGFHLGRYWPLVGPQITLYVPRHILSQGENTIVIVEYQKIMQGDITITFTDEPILDGP